MGPIDKKLQVGQTIDSRELETGSRVLTVLAPGRPGLQVIEVGIDYVVLDDADAGLQIRIPTHLIHSVVRDDDVAPQAA